MNSAYRSSIADSTASLPGTLADRARDSLAAAEQIGAHLGPQGHLLVVHAQNAFLDGLSRGLIGGAVALLIGALFVAIRAPGRAESRANATAESRPRLSTPQQPVHGAGR
jgi:hypothetical protein